MVSGGWYLLLVELWPADARPYIGGSQHDSIVELALGYNGLGRLTGNEPGGLGNLNFDVGWGRLFGSGMGLDIAWLLPAAVICLVAGFVITRRAPRTDQARVALILWGGWLVVTAVVFSFANGIVHPYYTVALAPAIGASIGIGATLLWRNRSAIRAATALSGTVLVTTILAAVLLSRDSEWMPSLRATVAVGGVGAAALLLVAGRLPKPSPVPWRPWPSPRVWRRLPCIRSRRRPQVTAARSRRSALLGMASGASPGLAGCLTRRLPGPRSSAMLSADAHDYTWVAAVVGSNNAAGYQLASGAPIMAVGGFNGTDPSPTLEEFQRYVADRQIHYFIRGKMMIGHWGGTATGSHESADIAEWVETHYTPQTVDRVIIYDLTQPPRNS